MTPSTPTLEDRLGRALRDAAAQVDVQVPQRRVVRAVDLPRRRSARGLVAVAVGVVVVLVAVMAALGVRSGRNSSSRDAVGPAVGGRAPVEVSPEALREGMADVDVWMTVNATTAQIESVRSAIEESALIKRFAFADQEVAFETFRRLYRDKPDLVANVDAGSLPTSFRIVSRSCSARADVAEALEQLAGVDEVAFSPGYTRKDAALLGSKNEPYLRGRGRCPKPQR